MAKVEAYVLISLVALLLIVLVIYGISRKGSSMDWTTRSAIHKIIGAVTVVLILGFAVIELSSRCSSGILVAYTLALALSSAAAVVAGCADIALILIVGLVAVLTAASAVKNCITGN